MDIAVRELFRDRDFELPPEQILGIARQFAQIKAEIVYGYPELITKKSLGENIVLLYYRYHTDQWQIFSCFEFARNLDKNGEPQHWYCVNNFYSDSPAKILNHLR
jgi:hypothetical protein